MTLDQKLSEAQEAAAQLEYLKHQAEALPELERQKQQQDAKSQASHQAEIFQQRLDNEVGQIKSQKVVRDGLIDDLAQQTALTIGSAKQFELALDNLWKNTQNLVMWQHKAKGQTYTSEDILYGSQQILADNGLKNIGQYQGDSDIQQNVRMMLANFVQGL